MGLVVDLVEVFARTTEGIDSGCNCTIELRASFTKGNLIAVAVEILIMVIPGVVKQPKLHFTRRHYLGNSNSAIRAVQ